MWKGPEEIVQSIRQNFGKNKGVILSESMDDITLVNSMENFFMNKIHHGEEYGHHVG